jgi:hypothetical protein
VYDLSAHAFVPQSDGGDRRDLCDLRPQRALDAHLESHG